MARLQHDACEFQNDSIDLGDGEAPFAYKILLKGLFSCS